jgi:hypothetical protein
MRVTLQTFSTSHSKISPTRSAILPLIAFFFFFLSPALLFSMYSPQCEAFTHQAFALSICLCFSFSLLFFFLAHDLCVSLPHCLDTLPAHTWTSTSPKFLLLLFFCAFWLLRHTEQHQHVTWSAPCHMSTSHSLCSLLLCLLLFPRFLFLFFFSALYSLPFHSYSRFCNPFFANLVMFY